MFSHGLHSSCSMFSHGIHGIHRTFLLYILPQIAQIYTEPSCCMFSHGIHGIHRTFLQYVLPRNSRNAQNLLAVYSPTEFTEYTEPSCSIFSHRFTQNLLAVYSPTEFTEYTEPSCCIFSHRLHRFSQMLLSRGCTCLKCTNPFCCCTSCSVGALLALLVHLRQVHPLERTYLCRSVKSVGEYFQQPLP